MMRIAHIVALIVFLAVTVAKADGLSAEKVRELVESGTILPLEEILKRNAPGIGGRIIEIEVERKRGIYLYEIKVLRPDGRYREMKIDARTGAMIGED